MEQESRSNAKLKSLPRSVRDLMWQMRNPQEEGEKKFSYVEVLAWLKAEHGVESSMGALSEFYSWHKLCVDMEDSFNRAEQAKMEILKARPDATPEALQAIGQLFFTNKAMQKEDLDGFVKLLAVWEKKQSRLLDQDKWEQAKAKAAQAEEAKEVLQQKLSPEEQNRRLREILK